MLFIFTTVLKNTEIGLRMEEVHLKSTNHFVKFIVKLQPYLYWKGSAAPIAADRGSERFTCLSLDLPEKFQLNDTIDIYIEKYPNFLCVILYNVIIKLLNERKYEK